MDNNENPVGNSGDVQAILNAVQTSPEVQEKRAQILARYLYQRIVAGPGVAILLHIVLLLMLLFMVKPDTPKNFISATVMLTPEGPPVEMEKIEKPPEPETPPETTPPDTMPEDNNMTLGDGPMTPYDPIVIGDPNIMDPTAKGSGGSLADGVGIGSGLGTEQGFEISVVASPLTFKGLYAGRTAGGRKGALTKYGGGYGSGGGGEGGGFPSETAVLKALRWLKTHQSEDGSWIGSDSKTAMAGLALLCFMAHGETPSSEEFGQTVEKAIRYLMYAQSADGRFSNAGENYVYGHAIATYALAESYTMTRIVTLKDPVEKATQVIIDGQQPGGAWDYLYNKGIRKDLSVSAWQIQALKAAKLSGASNPKLAETITKAVDGVRSFAVGGGYLAYNGNMGGQTVPSPTLTAAGVLCLQLLGLPADRTVKDGIDALSTLDCSWEKGKADNNTYAWYYATQANFQNGSGPWERWNKRILPMLVQNQAQDGHWLQGVTHRSSDVYDTTLCCLCLEVYYRYLPTYEREAEVKSAPKTKSEADAKFAVEVSL